MIRLLIFYKSAPDDFKIDFTSACAITGNVLAYNKNNTKKNPMVPINIPISTKVGENIATMKMEGNHDLMKLQ